LREPEGKAVQTGLIKHGLSRFIWWTV